MKILIINGPNINMLGIREPEIYGNETYEDLKNAVLKAAEKENAECDFFQSNHEGDIIDEIQKAYGKYDGIIINPAGYTHTSVAIPDALKAVGIPTWEVHISDIEKREDFRKRSFVTPACKGCIKGQGINGYCIALKELSDFLNQKKSI